MKKVLIAVLALAAVACNKAEIVEQTPANAIAFESVFVDNATKSVSDPSYANDNLFSDFAVYGFVQGATLFDGKPVTGSGINGTWTYTGTQYWIDGAKYNFAAVAPFSNKNWNTTNFGIGETNLYFTNNGTQDVLYAQSAEITGAASGNSKVGFTFRHILSKVKFSFENKYLADDTKIQVRNIKINNAYKTGNVTLTSGTPVWKDQAGTLELKFGNAASAFDANEPIAHNATAESYNELLLIPGAVEGGYKVTFTYDILVGEGETKVKEFTKTATVNFTPEAGHAYDFKATITPGELIEFTVTPITGWTTETEGTM